MHIRRAHVDDAAAVCGVLRRSIAELCESDHHSDAAVLDRWLANKTPENVAARIASPEGHMFVAIDGIAILGVAAITAAGEITLNYVSPDARFCGVSKRLLRELEATARQLGLSACTLTSTATAYRFYLSAGYQDAGADDGLLHRRKPAHDEALVARIAPAQSGNSRNNPQCRSWISLALNPGYKLHTRPDQNGRQTTPGGRHDSQRLTFAFST